MCSGVGLLERDPRGEDVTGIRKLSKSISGSICKHYHKHI